MPLPTPNPRTDRIREYHRVWNRKRRDEFFFGKSCAQCGSTKRLELDHIDPKAKLHHAIWTWRESRRSAEIAKCQILCHECHKQKTRLDLQKLMTGKPNTPCQKLSASQVLKIRRAVSSGETERSIAQRFKIAKTTVHSIKTGECYASVL